MQQTDLFHILDRAANHALTISESGPLTERSPDGVRRPSATPVRVSGMYRIGTPQNESVVQSYLVQESRHKEASAESIRLMALSLRQLRCPPDLILRVDRAANEKLRHADSLAAAAYRPRSANTSEHDEGALTDLVGFASETATERCVSETYAAARFAYQAQRSESPELRDVFSDVARDDAAHAELFWELLRWSLSQISPARARRIEEEQRLVREALRDAVEMALPEDLHRFAGVPDAEAGHALMDALEFELWSEAAA